MNKQGNFQDLFLNTLRKEKIDITIYLTNGFQFKGRIKCFDNFTILLDSEGKDQLVFKHAVSTIIPRKSIDFTKND